MKSISIRVVIICLILYGCIQNNQQKNIDFEFYSNYKNCIQIILKRNVGCEVSAQRISKSYDCMETITGIKSTVMTGNEAHHFYLNDSLLRIDIRNWDKWYVENKYYYNMELANRAFDKKNNLNESLKNPLRDSILGASDYDWEWVEWPSFNEVCR